MTARTQGPSPEAIERLDTVLVCMFDLNRPMTLKQIKDELSEPMSGSDVKSAVRRLAGAKMVTLATFEKSEKPWQWKCTPYGRAVAIERIEKGVGY